ncbi:DUF2800 domain-containing protein [Corynebacterium auriscanis]|uniref:DUF2800 domain-containing protein n=1 Tax=Corynebacterium auriscanis TaxID=99807 RepID=UPI0025B59E52|nr:DUF2800 domain-containing protein [Corynebacterium auriscanis]WJY73254.1 PD-(D/E)XK nuclease superfamily protein [Corynebacterium auriscanis]
MTHKPPAGHADRDHALLSASGANRWLNCTPSALIETRYPDTSSDAADQGTAAHELAEHKLRNHLGTDTTRPTSTWHDEEMEDHTDAYADHVMAELTRTKETSPAAFLSIEERLDFSHIVPDGFGTGDAVIVGDDTMTIVDLKYGKGVEVSAKNNPQMRLYALGALARYGMIYNIKTVRMVIFQPRLNNISVDETSVEELTTWARDVVEPRAHLAAAGEGELTPGQWCTFCKHAAQCPAIATQYFDAIPTTSPGVPAAPDPDTLTDEQIATIVTHSGELKKWLTKVEKHALEQANDGRTYPGLKLVEGRSVRRFTDTTAVAQAVENAGHDPYKRTLLGLTDLTKLLGKKQFDTLLGEFIEKPAGKPTLVPASDKRPELSVATADNVFHELGKEPE